MIPIKEEIHLNKKAKDLKTINFILKLIIQNSLDNREFIFFNRVYILKKVWTIQDCKKLKFTGNKINLLNLSPSSSKCTYILI